MEKRTRLLWRLKKHMYTYNLIHFTHTVIICLKAESIFECSACALASLMSLLIGTDDMVHSTSDCLSRPIHTMTSTHVWAVWETSANKSSAPPRFSTDNATYSCLLDECAHNYTLHQSVPGSNR